MFGQRERQLQVQVDSSRLEAADLTLLDVVKTTGNALWVSPLTYLQASTPGTGGFIDGPNQRISIQHVFSINSPEDLASVPIEGGDGLTLGDVVNVVENHQPLIGDAVVDDGDGLVLVVEKFPWSNTAGTTRSVEEALDELAPGLTGVVVDTELFRPAGYVERSIDNVQRTALVSLVAAAILLFLLFSGWRAAIVSLVSIVASLIGAALVLVATDTTIDTMVLAGLVLALVMIIGDGIADADAIRQRLAEPDRSTILESARISDAVRGARTPALYAGVVLLVVMVPLFVMDGAAGEFLPSVALTVGAALLVSMVIGLIVTPALSSLLYGIGTPSADQPTPLRWLHDRYASAFAPGRSMFLPAVLGAAVIAVAGVALIPTLDREFVPQLKQTDLLVRLDAVPGTSLGESTRLTSEAAAELRGLDGVENVGAHVGRAVLSDQVSNVNSSELWINIDPDADYDATLDDIRRVVQGYPGFGRPDVLTYANGRVDDVLRQSHDDLVVRLYGEDPAVLAETGTRLAALTADVDGTSNVRVRRPVFEPIIEIEVDLERGAEFQVKPGDVRRAAATLLSGIEVGSFFEQQKVFEVIVWSDPELGNSITDVQDLLIDTPSGEVIALSQLADVSVAPNQTVIERDAASRYVDVIADVEGRGIGAVEADVKTAIASAGLPFEYHARVLDDREDATDNQRDVIAVALTAAVAAFLIVQAAVNSWRLALLVMAATVLALGGGVVTLAISGGTYSLGSALGFFAIAGIGLRTALALVRRFESAQLQSPESEWSEIVAQSARDRLGPVVTTLLVIVAAMAPIVLFGGIAGQEIIRPLAIVVLGGVLSTAAVSLFVLPAICARLARPAAPRDEDLSSDRWNHDEVWIDLSTDGTDPSVELGV